MNLRKYLQRIAQGAREASRRMASLSRRDKDALLRKMAQALRKAEKRILRINQAEVSQARKQGKTPAFIDRLTLNPKRIQEMAEGLVEVSRLHDPVGEEISRTRRPNGLLIRKLRVPLGVVAVIYESRPNVTVDAASLCLKSGNAVILRGGSEAIRTNGALAQTLRKALRENRLPEGAVGFVDVADRRSISILARMEKWVDVIIPRGGEEMIRKVRAGATVPVIAHGKGVCHTYVDSQADLGMANEICFNAKTQRPGVCNAMETLLVHKDVAKKFLPQMAKRYLAAGVELRGCPRTRRILSGICRAAEKDWSTEYLDLILSVKVVDSLQEAVGHIQAYGSAHSDAIVTGSRARAREFLSRIDSAAVFWNASTRFTDGGQFGMGSEIGISTQKLHARGPMGLTELTSFKFVIEGKGQIRI